MCAFLEEFMVFREILILIFKKSGLVGLKLSPVLEPLEPNWSASPSGVLI